ncbi:MAG TPA: hypothetical protein VKT28_17805 [Puia sp.]|nr:hypothetical protein [Puia sp.]
MLTTPSVMGLHLRYRLWIAELNHDITMLRIFDDYLQEIKNKKVEPEVKKEVENFKNRFIELRKEIDELRHEMHLHKMNLAAESRENNQANKDELKSADHSETEKRYQTFRKLFEQAKNEFISFEGKSLQ